MSREKNKSKLFKFLKANKVSENDKRDIVSFCELMEDLYKYNEPELTKVTRESDGYNIVYENDYNFETSKPVFVKEFMAQIKNFKSFKITKVNEDRVRLTFVL